MGLSASLDGILTAILIWCLWRSRSPSMDWTNDLIQRMIALTLETVLLTHLCGAIMCIAFLSQPARHRTKTTVFWICLEIITELYALSVVFTINARSFARRTFREASSLPVEAPAQRTSLSVVLAERPLTKIYADPRRLDFAVEGVQDIASFSHHFPDLKGQLLTARQTDEGVEVELMQLSVLPREGDLQGMPMGTTKEL